MNFGAVHLPVFFEKWDSMWPLASLRVVSHRLPRLLHRKRSYLILKPMLSQSVGVLVRSNRVWAEGSTYR